MPPQKRATRRTLLAAAIAAVVGDLAFVQRKDRYLSLARRHRRQAAPLTGSAAPEVAFRRYHLDLARRYEHAACRPWLSVTPGAPPPSNGNRGS